MLKNIDLNNMKKIIYLLISGIALFASSCGKEERLYDGPDIAYFDNKGLVRDEIAENNTIMTFRIVSPLATKHDREYSILKRFGSTMEEGKDYSFPQGRKAVIKAGSYWVDVNIAMVPESLSAKVDTLAFGLEAYGGEVAAFDNELRLLVSKRCDFVPELYAGEYNHTTELFPYQPDHTVVMQVVRKEDGSVDPDALLIKRPYAGGDVLMRMDYSNPKKITPVIEMQPAGTISTYDPWMEIVTVPFYVHTTEQHTYPRIFEKRANESYLYTCSGEFIIYIVAGVFFKDEDGSIIEGILGNGAAEEKFKRLTLPYDTPAKGYSEAMNVEVRAEVKSVKY